MVPPLKPYRPGVLPSAPPPPQAVASESSARAVVGTGDLTEGASRDGGSPPRDASRRLRPRRELGVGAGRSLSPRCTCTLECRWSQAPFLTQLEPTCRVGSRASLVACTRSRPTARVRRPPSGDEAHSGAPPALDARLPGGRRRDHQQP